MTPAQLDTLNDEFSSLQSDLGLTDTYFQQCGDFLALRKAGCDAGEGDLAMFFNNQPDDVIARKVKSWCVKNRYRCTKISGTNSILM